MRDFGIFYGFSLVFIFTMGVLVGFLIERWLNG